MTSWLDEGLPHIWLPYTQMKTAAPPLPVVAAQGCRIQLADGRELIDGIASWWSACHGYRHPHIEQAVKKQLENLPHIMFGGLAHEQAFTLAARLCRITPEGLNRVFFSDSGSTAVEVALKMALQYWRNLGKTGKDRFLCFHDGYHGDTMGAMAVSDPENGMHKAFRGAMPWHYAVPIPQDEYGFAEFEDMLKGLHQTIAAVIIEPLVQGAGGMRFHSADVLAELRRLAREYEVLFIADEIATGFYRTGSLFACDEAAVTPDIMCIGKALTGGTLGLGATLATETVFNAFLSDDPQHALMHGPTFMANPLACAAANASLDLFEKWPAQEKVEQIEQQLLEELKPCMDMPCVTDVRVKGAIGVVQLPEEQLNLPLFRARFIEAGVWLRPFKDIIYILPPLVVSQQELSQLTGAVCATVREWSSNNS